MFSNGLGQHFRLFGVNPVPASGNLEEPGGRKLFLQASEVGNEVGVLAFEKEDFPVIGGVWQGTGATADFVEIGGNDGIVDFPLKTLRGASDVF